LAMTFDDVRAFAFQFPGVTDGTAYGHPCLKAHDKFLTRVWDDGDTLVCPGVTFDERELLIEAEPETFFVTDHYKGYPYVLIRLSRADTATVERFIERYWRDRAPKKVLAAHDAGKA
jgi:hypothetical protein